MKHIILALFTCLVAITGNSLHAFEATLTGYNEHEPDHKPYGDLNCQGNRLEVGQCAADLRYHPLGQRIQIDGMGTYVVADCGSAIKGPNRFDIYVDSMSECRNFGVKHASASVVGEKHPQVASRPRLHSLKLSFQPYKLVETGFSRQSSKSQRRYLAMLDWRREEGMVATL